MATTTWNLLDVLLSFCVLGRSKIRKMLLQVNKTAMIRVHDCSKSKLTRVLVVMVGLVVLIHSIYIPLYFG